MQNVNNKVLLNEREEVQPNGDRWKYSRYQVGDKVFVQVKKWCGPCAKWRDIVKEYYE